MEGRRQADETLPLKGLTRRGVLAGAIASLLPAAIVPRRDVLELSHDGTDFTARFTDSSELTFKGVPLRLEAVPDSLWCGVDNGVGDRTVYFVNPDRFQQAIADCISEEHNG